MLASIFHDQRHFCFRDFVCVNPDGRLAVMMDLEHQSRRLGVILVKVCPQHRDDIIHGSIIIIKKEYLIERRFLETRGLTGHQPHLTLGVPILVMI